MDFTQRKKRFVNAQIQGALLKTFCGFWVVYHICLWHMMFLVSLFQQPLGKPLLAAYAEFLTSATLLPILALAFFPIVLWSMLCLTHRIAGPLVQLENKLREMAEGKPATEIKFRDDDLLEDVGEAFNAYVAYCRANGMPAAPEGPTGDEDEAEKVLRDTVALQSSVWGRTEETPEATPSKS